MTFGEYIEALFSTGFFGKNQAKIVIGIFDAAKSKAFVSDASARAWINGTRNCDIAKYFPDEAVNEAELIKYFSSRTKDIQSWKKLQDVFTLKQSTCLEKGEFRVDCNTEDSEVFYWSLLNQFQKIFRLPESERATNNAPSGNLKNGMSFERVRNIFMEGVRCFKVMDIVNRKPAILNREDSANLNIFIDRMDALIINSDYRSQINPILHASIKNFTEALQIQTLSLDAALNNRFDFEDESASINMEEPGGCANQTRRPHQLEIPELSLTIISDANDPLHLLEIAVKEWGNFRNNMNWF